MDYKQIPNIFSFLRIILSLIFGYYFNILLNYNQDIILTFMVFVLILFTDFIDGYIARKTSNSTNVGVFLDVSADLFYVLISYTILTLNNLIHPLFVLLLVFKFVEFIYTSRKIGTQNNNKLVFDTLGKNMSKVWMLFPGIVCILCSLQVDNLSLIINVFAFVTMLLALVSTGTRLINSRK